MPEKSKINSGALQYLFTKPSTFRFKSAQHGADCFSGASDGYIYTRIANPTIRALEQNIAALENGFDGIATSSGMAAITSVYMALLNAGDHIISTAAVYGPARGVLEQDFARFQVEASFVNTADIEEIKKQSGRTARCFTLKPRQIQRWRSPTLDACSKIARSMI